MKIEKLPRSIRGGTAVLLLALVAVGAWRSIPSDHDIFTPTTVAIDRLVTRERGAHLAPPKLRNGEASESGVRLQPGGAMEFDLTRWEGVLWCRFQTSTPKSATIEVTAFDDAGSIRVARRELMPQASQADSQPFVLLVDPAALPNLRKLVVGVTAESASSVEWTELRLAKKEELTIWQTAPFRVLAYDGLYAPLGEDTAVFVHAPACLSLVVPVGRHQFTTAFGLNPNVIAQPGSGSDGVGFELTLETRGSGNTRLFQQLVEPGLRKADRELHRASVSFENTSTSILRLVVDPGPHGNIAWDSAVWRDFRTGN